MSNPGELEKLQQDWNDLAELDPMWAIASIHGKEFNKWDPKEFFLSGRTHIAEALSIVKQSGVELIKESALDFGCGMGRLTQALAEEFEVCYGVDISPRMVELAKQFNHFGDRCKCILNSRSDFEIFESNFFDFIYTAEVLQHIPPDLARNYLRKCLKSHILANLRAINRIIAA